MSDIILAGVGGQGTVMASRLIASCAIASGIPAHTAETIGMAQRGGSVVSHVRIGGESFSTLIPYKKADVIIGFEPSEAVRALAYLKENGTVIVNSAAVKPVTDSLSESSYSSEDMINYLKTLPIKLYVINGALQAEKCGSAKALNIVLLGAAAHLGVLGISVEELREALKASVKPQYLDMNMNAVECGIKSAMQA